MSLKSAVSEGVSSSVNEIERHVQDLAERVDDARDALSDWGDDARRFVRKNPGVAIGGAFALGFALATLLRRRRT
ncbi:MAG TPA: hypothetical protein VHU40_08555 [Polyangia bacterium]|jgi:MYXO-CTERM domain-containing protein|nr:hypothetical protein [Polyangia bacterium]